MTAETDIAAIADAGDNTPGDVRTALTSVLARADVYADEKTDWTTWSPSYSNLTVGNGTVVARYAQVGKIVVAYFQFNLGSTSSVGTNPTVSLPVTRSSQYTTNRFYWSDVYLRCNGTQYPGLVRSPSTTTVGPLYMTTSGGDVVASGITASAPQTWTTDDEIAFGLTYEAA